MHRAGDSEQLGIDVARLRVDVAAQYMTRHATEIAASSPVLVSALWPPLRRHVPRPPFSALHAFYS